MIVSVIYPNHDGAKFDVDYYLATHTPLVQAVWNPDRIVLVQGDGAATGGPAPFAMIGHFHFASAEAMGAAMAHPRMAELQADVANFTDITPVAMLGHTPG